MDWVKQINVILSSLQFGANVQFSADSKSPVKYDHY